MKALKKLSCVLLAVLLLMSLSVTAFASGGDPVPGLDVKAGDKVTLTVNDTTLNRKYVAYQILTGSIGADGALGDAAWGANVSDTFKAGKTPAEYFEGVTDARALAEALMVEGMLTGDPIELNKEEGVEDGKYFATVDAGYYLIVEERTTERGENEPISQYIVEVVGDTNVKPKRSEMPEFEKKVQDINDSTGETSGWQDSADWDIGDEVPFQLKATLPEDGFINYRTYTLTFHDNMDAGLTFDPDSVVVKVAGREIDKSKYTVTSTGLTDGCTFEITISDVKADPFNCEGGEEITVEYEATLNTNAVIGAAGNDNTAHLEFSNNPNSNGTGNTKPDTVTVFTFDFNVDKVEVDTPASEGVTETYKALAGAEFTLQKWNGTAWVAIDKVVPELGEGEEATSFTFTGLDDGYYRLEETKTPTGYNSIDPIYFAVEAKHQTEADDPQLTEMVVKTLAVTETEGGTSFEVGEEAGDFTYNLTKAPAEEGGPAGYVINTQIVNQKGLELPETGGIGTTIFYTVGGILVAAALILLITKKRMSKEA